MDETPKTADSQTRPAAPETLSYFAASDDRASRAESSPVPLATIAHGCAMACWGLIAGGTLVLAWLRDFRVFLLAIPLSVLSILALVLGIRAKRKCEADPDLHIKASRAVWMGAVQTCLMLALGVRMLWDWHTEREWTRQVQCYSHLHQIGRGLELYANWYKNLRYPDTLMRLIDDGFPPGAFVCPSSDAVKATGATTREVAEKVASGPRFNSYIYVGAGLPYQSPDDCVLAYEPLSNHNGRGANVLFKNGDVGWFSPEEMKHLIAELQAGRNPPLPRPKK